MSKPKRALKNLKFLRDRHANAGFDVDYLQKLNGDELAFLEDFARKYYGGDPQQPMAHKKEANQRRYRAERADAMGRADFGSIDFDSELNISTPESYLLLKEELEECAESPIEICPLS